MDLKNLKEFKEYTRIKKIDVRKWLLRGHAPLHPFYKQSDNSLIY